MLRLRRAVGMPEAFWRVTTIVVLWPSNTYVLGVDSVNFRTLNFGGAYCVLRVMFHILVLRCMMFIFCVKEADLGM